MSFDSARSKEKEQPPFFTEGAESTAPSFFNVGTASATSARGPRQLINLIETHSLLNRYVFELRDLAVQKDRMRFRRNLERIGEIIAYEISKTMRYVSRSVPTCLGTAVCHLPAETPVVAAILRAGLPLHQGVLNYFDDADCSFVSAYRKHDTAGGFEIQLEYCSCPDLTDRTVIIADPMLATGASAVLTIRELVKFGKPSAIHLVAAIASAQGVANVQEYSKEIVIWAAALDPELDERAYIVPGLGDAGDLAYGPKLQR